MDDKELLIIKNRNLEVVKNSFPRISDRIELLWNSPECLAYLKGLVIDDRGNRKGFPDRVLVALINLVRAHPDSDPSIHPFSNII